MEVLSLGLLWLFYAQYNVRSNVLLVSCKCAQEMIPGREYLGPNDKIKYFKVKYFCFLTAYVRVGSSRSVVFVDGLDSP